MKEVDFFGIKPGKKKKAKPFKFEPLKLEGKKNSFSFKPAKTGGKNPFKFRPVRLATKKNVSGIKKKNLTWPQAVKRYPKVTMFGDADKDGKLNMFDCKPFDKTRHSALLRADIRERLRIKEAPESEDYKGKWDFLERENKKMTAKAVVRIFEKNPELIKIAEKMKGSGDFGRPKIIIKKTFRSGKTHGQYHRVSQGNKPRILIFNPKDGKLEYQKGEKQPETKENYVLVERELPLTFDVNRGMKHELYHAIQDQEGRADLLLAEDRDLAEEKYGGDSLPWAQRPAEIEARAFEKRKFERDKVNKERPQRLETLDEPYKVDEAEERETEVAAQEWMEERRREQDDEPEAEAQTIIDEIEDDKHEED